MRPLFTANQGVTRSPLKPKVMHCVLRTGTLSSSMNAFPKRSTTPNRMPSFCTHRPNEVTPLFPIGVEKPKHQKGKRSDGRLRGSHFSGVLPERPLPPSAMPRIRPALRSGFLTGVHSMKSPLSSLSLNFSYSKPTRPIRVVKMKPPAPTEKKRRIVLTRSLTKKRRDTPEESRAVSVLRGFADADEWPEFWP